MGPVSLRNYAFRAEAHCALKSSGRMGEHPIIRLESPELAAWQEYFEVHLGGRPFMFTKLLDKSLLEMTVPEPVPQWFDSSFVPDPRWRPHVMPGAEI